MTVSNTDLPVKIYTGTATEYPIPFDYISDDDILVTLYNTETGAATDQTIDVDYTIVEETVTYSEEPGAEYNVVIRRVTPYTQEASFGPGEEPPLSTHESAFDKLTMLAQDLDERLGRAFILPDSSGIRDLSFPHMAANAGKLIRINEDGTGLDVLAVGDSGQVTEVTEYCNTGDLEKIHTSRFASYGSVSSMVNAIGSTRKHLVCDTDVTLTEDTIFPATMSITIENGGSIALGDYNLTINGPFEGSPGCFICNGTGAVTFSSGLVTAHPEWWGAMGDGATDDTSALSAAFSSQAGTVAFMAGKQYVLSSDLIVSQSISVRGNNASIISTGQLVFSGELIESTYLSASVSPGAIAIPVDDASGINSGDLLVIQDSVDSSFSAFRESYRKGEFLKVKSVEENTINLFGRLQDSYPAGTTTKIHKVNSISVNIADLTINSTGVGGIRLNQCENSVLYNVCAKTGGTSLRAIGISTCFNVAVINCSGICDAPSAGYQYGLSIGQSQQVCVVGGHYYGSRHGVTFGSSGLCPARDSIVYGATISAESLGAADFHGHSVGCWYVNCTINGAVWLGGRDTGYDNCKIYAKRTDGDVVLVVEAVGGSLTMRNCKVCLPGGFSFIQIMSFYDQTLQDHDVHLLFDGLEIEVSSSVNRVASFAWNMSGTVDLSATFRNIQITGDTSALTAFLLTQVLTAANPGGHAVPPAPPKFIRLHNIEGMPNLDPFGWVYKSTGSLDTTSISLPKQSGLVSIGQNGDLVSYSFALPLADDEEVNYRLPCTPCTIRMVSNYSTDASFVGALQANSGVTSMFSGSKVAVGSSDNPDEAGKLNVWMGTSSTRLGIKNRLGSTRIFYFTIEGPRVKAAW